MTLDELSTAWNDLRNAALGRGVAPVAPEALAREISREYDRWRKALMHLPPVADMLGSIATREWVVRYRVLEAKLKKAGITPATVLPTTPIEAALKNLGDLTRNVAIGLGVAGVGLLTALLIKRGMRNGR